MSRNLVIIAISMVAWGIGESAFIAFQPLYLQKLGASPVQIGAIFGAVGLAGTLTHIPAGFLADRVGRRPLMWAGWIQGLITTWIMALANSLTGFALGMVLYGMTMYVMSPVNSYVTAARGRLSVARAITLISAAYNLGAIIGPFIGGWLGERYGFRSIFIYAGCVFIISSAVILFIHPQPRETLPPTERSTHLFKNTRYLIYLPVMFLVIFATYLPQPLSPNFLQNQRALSLENIGQLYAFMGLGIVAFNLILGQLNAHLGFLVSQLAVGAFAWLIWHGNGGAHNDGGMIIYSLAYFLVGGFRTLRAMVVALARPLVHQSDMGLAYGLLETAAAIAMILAAPLAGALYAHNPSSMYPVSLGLIFLALLVSTIRTIQVKSNEKSISLQEQQP